MSLARALLQFEPANADRMPRLALAGWLLAVGFFLCPASTWLLIPGVLSWSDAFLLAAVLVYFSGTALQHKGLQIPICILLTVSLLLIACLGSYVNYSEDINPINCLKFVASLFLIPICVMWCTKGHRDLIDRALWFWLAGTCFSALVAVLSKYGFPVFGLQDKSTVFAGRPSGLTYHANVLSYTCALLIPVAIYLAITRKAAVPRYICIAAIALLIDGVLVSGSRAALIAVMASGLVWLPNFLKTRVHRSELIILGTGMLAIFCTVLFILFSDDPFQDSTNALSRLFGGFNESQQSNDARTKAAHVAYLGFSEAPLFGQGFEHLRRSHNGVLAILHSSGIVGLAGMLIWWGGISFYWWQLRGQAMRRGYTADIMLCKMFLAVALVEIVNGAFEPLLTDRNGYISIGLMLGLLLSPQFNRQSLHSHLPIKTNTLYQYPWPVRNRD